MSNFEMKCDCFGALGAIFKGVDDKKDRGLFHSK